MKWKKIYNYYIGSSIVMLILLAIMGALVIYPALRKITMIKNEIAAEKINLEKKLDMGLNAKKIKEDLESVEKQLSILDAVFIPQGEELTLLGNLESLAAKNNVSVVLKPDFKGVNMAGNVIRTPLVISATGNFKNIMAFLNGLDATDFFFVSDQISLTKAGKDNLDLNLTVTGQVYIKTL